MKEKSRCSVVITSFNYAEFVEASIRSVFEQVYEHLELVIVDDCSTDGSQQVIESVIANAPLPVKTIFKNRTEGQGSAMNTGFFECSGEVISFLDSDDYWYPNRLSTVLQFMDLIPGEGIYQHDLETTMGDKRGALLSADIFALLKKWDDGVFNIADDYTNALFSPFLPTSGLSFRREVLQRVMPIPEELTVSPDAYLTRTSIAYGRLISIPLKLGVWRDHGRNLGKSESASFESYWLPTVMPALNHYYETHGLGLQLYYDKTTRSRIPASLMLGEFNKVLQGTNETSVRKAKTAELPTPRPRPGLMQRIMHKLGIG